MAFIRESDVIINTNKGVFVLWKDTINALKFNDLDGKYEKVAFKVSSDDIFIFTSKSIFTLHHPSNVLKKVTKAVNGAYIIVATEATDDFINDLKNMLVDLSILDARK